MLRYIYGDDLGRFPKLAQSMYRNRAAQFSERLGWDVVVDTNGLERDEYDKLNPLYVIWEKADGSHGGSMRFLPTTERTMINDHFRHLNDGVAVVSPLIWECTRFCLAPDADAGTAAALMLGGAEVGVNFHLNHAVAVFDARMVRVYRCLGWPPNLAGSQGEGRERISLGFWEFSADVRNRLAIQAGIPRALSAQWFDDAFRIRAFA
jgi:N-acyl-L-homoserine lactone synthetase